MGATNPNLNFDASEEFLFGAAASAIMPNPVAASRPTVYARLSVSNLEHIPTELSAYDSWINWREDPPRNPFAKPNKTPISPRTKTGAAWNTPQNWTSRDVAVKVYTQSKQ